MTKYGLNGDAKRKLLVPAVALLLCAFALVGASYAALASSTSVSGNTVTTDGIVLSFKDEGINIASGDFGVGAMIKWGTIHDQDNATKKYRLESLTDKVIGKSTLNIDATGSTSVSKAIITCAVTETNLPEHASYKVTINGTEITAAGVEITVIPGSANNNYDVEVLLSTDATKTSDTRPFPSFDFKIEITATPVEASTP